MAEVRKYRKFNKGMKVGKFTLVTRNDFGYWIVRCGCGRLLDLNVSQAIGRQEEAAGKLDVACQVCWREAVRAKPRLCRWCGVTDNKKFRYRLRECMACERSRLRNGVCECGKVRRYNNGNKKLVSCSCEEVVKV